MIVIVENYGNGRVLAFENLSLFYSWNSTQLSNQIKICKIYQVDTILPQVVDPTACTICEEDSGMEKMQICSKCIKKEHFYCSKLSSLPTKKIGF